MSYEALRRIEECIAKRSTKLDLKNTDIHGNLPPELAELTWLHELDLSRIPLHTADRKGTPLDSMDYMSSNPLEVLTGMKQLRTLKLQSTRIKDIAPLSQLSNLVELNLFGTDVASLAPIANHSGLRSLYISNTKVTDLSHLKSLRRLQNLHLSRTKVTNIEPIAWLGELQSLDLSRTPIRNISVFNDLRRIRSIYLTETEIDDLKPLERHKDLQVLWLGGTRIVDLRPISECFELRILLLSHTRVHDLSSIRQLRKLEKLDISYTEVRDISPIEDLDRLQELLLKYAPVYSLAPISNQTNLRALTIEGSMVEDISPLSGHLKLEQLSIRRTGVKNLAPIRFFKNLKRLWIDDTAVRDLRPLSGLRGLLTLNLAGTKVRTLTPISKISSLVELDFRGTNVFDLSALFELTALASLRFDIEKIQFPPKEVLEIGVRAIVDYVRRFRRDIDADLKPKHNWFLKLVVVGNSGVGKSSLISSWMSDVAQYAEKTTEWVGYRSWCMEKAAPITITRQEKPGSTKIIKVSGTPTLLVFDFGGQDYYHDAHHLFFSSNTAYVVLWDTEHNRIGRKVDTEGIEQTHYPLNYWLDAIRYHCQLREDRIINWDVIEAVLDNSNTTVTFSNVTTEDIDDMGETNGSPNLTEISNSPQEVTERVSPRIVGVDFPMQALILQSRIDESPIAFPKMDELKARFPWIYDFDAVSMNPDNPARLDMTFSKLKEMISQIPLLGQPLAASWMWVRDALLKDNNERIVVKFTEFREWANQLIEINAPLFGVAPSKVKSLYFETRETESLLKYLSSLGIVLHYPDVDSLRERVFLRPGTIREQVLKVLQLLKKGEGYFTKEEVESHLQTKGNSGLDLESLLALMQEFKMAFEVSGPGSGTWIAPLYLPSRAPAGMEMLLEVFDKPIRRIVYPNFIHKSVTLELFQAFSQDLLPESHQGLASERHIVWRDGMVIRLKDSPEMVLVKFFIGAAATPDRAAQEAHIEVYAFKTPSGAKPAGKVLEKLREINHYWDTREEVTVEGKTFVPIETLYEAAKAHDTHFSHLGKSYPLEAYRSFVPIPWKRIFISYAAQDEGYCTELIKHLSPLNRTKRIAIWEKGQLIAGSERRLVQREEMDRADILILLISVDYFSGSEGELMEEYHAALQRAQERSATIGYIVIRDCDYESTELDAYRGLLGEGDVIGDVPRNDAMWKKVVGELKKVLPDGKGGGVR